MRQTSSFLTVGLTREELEDLHFNEEIWKEVEAILADDKKVVSLVSARDLNRGIYRWIKAGFQPVISLGEAGAEGSDNNLVARLKSDLESSSSDINRFYLDISGLQEKLTISNNDNERLVYKLDQMKSENERLTIILTNLRSDNERLVTVDSEYKASSYEFDRMKTQMIDELEALKNGHYRQIKQLRQENDQLKSDCNVIIADRDRLDGVKRKMFDDLSNLKKSIGQSWLGRRLLRKANKDNK